MESGGGRRGGENSTVRQRARRGWLGGGWGDSESLVEGGCERVRRRDGQQR